MKHELLKKAMKFAEDNNMEVESFEDNLYHNVKIVFRKDTIDD